jgi:hypothetical protein
VKIRDGAVANQPVYVALAVTTEGRREILGLWAGDGGEGAKRWLHILTEPAVSHRLGTPKQGGNARQAHPLTST